MSVRGILLALASASLLAGCQAIGPIRPAPTGAGGSGSSGQPAPPPPTPWQRARTQGMVFRAIGKQPDWSVEVEKSHSPTLFITLAGQSSLRIANATPFSDATQGTVGFRGTSADGRAVSLTIRRGQCQDPHWHGAAGAAAAQLDIAAQHYDGCGKFLF